MKKSGKNGGVLKPPGPKPSRPLAKIDPPRLANVYQRKRLFKSLDGLADRRVIWLSAPPGYGKTVAVASWLEARGDAMLWYQCDEGDGDVASFFYFLSLASANHARARSDPLPSLAPELYGSLPAFVRNYFREFCARLTAPCFLVLDNWQDIPPGAPLRELLPIAVGELPSGIVLVVISREELPANLSRLQLTGQVGTLGEDDLRLTERETRGITARYKRAAGQRSVMSVRDLHDASQGWAAGLAVMLRHEAGGRPVTRLDVNERAIQAVFDYLTSEVFDRLSEPVKDFLLKTACLDYVTAPVAARLTDNPGARGILESLVRNNTFTLQRPASATYYYHPLFRQLLRSRAAARFSIVEQTELLIEAAHLLAESQDPERAINLLLEAGRWRDASQMVLRVAPVLIQQGRFKTLALWIEALPQPPEFSAAWLSYWHGMAQMAIAFADAAATFERAYARFRAENDTLGQMLAIAAILQHHHISFTAFGGMRPWIAELVGLLQADHPFPSPSVELSILTGLFSAIVLADPANPRRAGYLDRIARLMRSEADTQSKASAAVALMNYFAIAGDIVQWRALLPASEWRHDNNELGPASRIQNLWMHAYQYQLTGEAQRCQALLDAGVEIARQHCLPAFEARLILSKLQATDYASHAAELPEALARLEPEFEFATPLMVSHYRYVCAMFHLAQGDLPAASRDIEAAEIVSRETGYPMARVLIVLGMGEILCELGRLGEAAGCLSRCRELISGFPSPLVEFNAGLLQAEIARKAGHRALFIEALGAALVHGRAQGFANQFHSHPVLLPRLIPYALEHRIEVEYCRWLIRRRNFRPPVREVSAWPWPIRIRSLGRFEVEVDDRPLEVRGKSQRRPLNLLKAMLVNRNGVEIDLLIDRFGRISKAMRPGMRLTWPCTGCESS